MKVFYITNKKPCSFNNKPAKAKFIADVQSEFSSKYCHLYTGLPTEDKTLKAHIVLIHQLNKNDTPDADNLSKPLIDAFCGIIYKDDEQVISRKAEIIKLKDFDFMTIDATDMPPKILDNFNDYYTNKEKHILYVGFADFSPSQIKIGEL